MNFSITKEEIKSMASNEEVYYRGIKYSNEKKVKSINLKESPSVSTVISKVMGNYKDYNVAINFSQGGKVESYSCNCEAHNIWRGACKHVVCVLISILDSKAENALALKNQRIVGNFIRSLEEQAVLQMNSEIRESLLTEGSITLTPFIQIIRERPALSFTVGNSATYKVKNVVSFLDNIKKGETVTYGKKLTFQHRLEMFDKNSISLIKLLMRQEEAVSELYGNFFNSFFSFRINQSNGNNMVLVKWAFDEFFEIYKNTEINGIFNEEKVKLRLVDSSPDIKYAVNKNGNVITLSGRALNIVKLEGEQYDFLLIEGILYKTSKKLGKLIATTQTTLNSLEGTEIEFSEERAEQFLALGLPQFAENGLLEGSMLLEEYEKNKLQIKYYLDSPKNIVTAKIKLCYGETEFFTLEDSAVHGLKGRNIFEERKAVEILKQFGFKEDKAKEIFSLESDELVYTFYKDGVEILNKIGQVYATDDFSQKSRLPKTTKATYGVRLKGNLLELTLDTSDYTIKELIEAANAYTVEKKFFRLKSGKFISFEDDTVLQANNLLNALSLTGKEVVDEKILLPKFRAMQLDSLMDAYIDEGLNTEVSLDSGYRKIAEDFKSLEELRFEVPEEHREVLRNYQKVGFNWLKTLIYYGFGGILADDMGLGKTLQVISVLLSEFKEGHPPSLVVSPTSLIYNWESEIKKFAPVLKTQTISGTPQQRAEIIEGDTEAQVYITTYDLLKRDIELYKSRSFRFVIADEAQFIKNPMTQNAKTLKELNSQVRFALTGTPIENSLTELWSIFDFIMPGFLFTEAKFAKHYSTPIIKNDDQEKATLLRKQIAPFILRRLKSNVLKELPEKVETTLLAEMYPRQKKLYAATLLKARGELEDAISNNEYGKSQLQILAQLTRLRQICCHPSMFVEDYDSGSGKLDLALETVLSAKQSGQRVLLFSQFTKMLSLLKEALTNEGIGYYYLDGTVSARGRVEMVNQFNAGSKDVFLISLKAGGTGLNLTGADVVIHYDPWWNPAVMDQASDRAHRFGQQKTVYVINLVAKDSIEEKILELQQKKRHLIDSVIQEGASFINKMTVDEVRELFS